ncbi:MAG: alpha/beta hydrolase [Lachnospiraceae bacterium]|nr:alpha/beta hydrolase [Lachnospiraceae bacterium]
MKRLAIVFPGIGYHKDKPLLYYSTKLAQAKGYEIIHIEYHDLPAKVKGDAVMMKKAAEIACEQTEEQLKDIPFDEYDDILMIGKSIGTVVGAKFASNHALQARQLWYTPVEATFLFTAETPVIAFIGESDPWSDLTTVKSLAVKNEIPLFTYPGANHSLETGDALTDIATLKDVMERTDGFIG